VSHNLRQRGLVAAALFSAESRGGTVTHSDAQSPCSVEHCARLGAGRSGRRRGERNTRMRVGGSAIDSYARVSLPTPRAKRGAQPIERPNYALRVSATPEPPW